MKIQRNSRGDYWHLKNPTNGKGFFSQGNLIFRILETFIYVLGKESPTSVTSSLAFQVTTAESSKFQCEYPNIYIFRMESCRNHHTQPRHFYKFRIIPPTSTIISFLEKLNELPELRCFKTHPQGQTSQGRRGSRDQVNAQCWLDEKSALKTRITLTYTSQWYYRAQLQARSCLMWDLKTLTGLPLCGPWGNSEQTFSLSGTTVGSLLTEKPRERFYISRLRIIILLIVVTVNCNLCLKHFMVHNK